MSAPTPEDIQKALRVLEAVREEPTLLSTLPEEARVAFMRAAGQVSRPTRLELIKVNRRLRKERRLEAQRHDRSVRASADIRVARQAAVFTAPERLLGSEAAAERELKDPRNCYVCKAEFRRLHFFYDSMCPDCAKLNYDKRFQRADLRGKTAVVTGSRLKIGYQIALILLRSGATVVATTRFPNDSALRYAKEADYDDWKDRLHVHGLDLRHTPSVEIFARWLDRSLGRLDILVNNAAQTVRRPAGFYSHLLALESKAPCELPPDAARLLAQRSALMGALAALPAARRAEGEPDTTGLAVWYNGGPGAGVRHSAALSQLRHTHDDLIAGGDIFPMGELDADLQQVDLRTMNSWRMALADVPTAEMLETHLVNAVAPFVLCARLKPLMLRTEGDKHVVNVSAMEGSFSRKTKTDKHPHTNMAKAALNMMTLTSAPDYAKDRIFMNAVDTGWVTDEDPAQISARKQAEHDFQPPLDVVDGAARVLDPVLTAYNGEPPVSGKFLKDYKPTDW